MSTPDHEVSIDSDLFPVVPGSEPERLARGLARVDQAGGKAGATYWVANLVNTASPNLCQQDNET